MVKINYRFLYILFIGIFLTSCKVLPEKNNAILETSDSQLLQELVDKNTEGFIVKGWADKSASNNGKAFVVWASLFRNGALLSGIVLHASWPDPTAERGIKRCDVLVNYGRGICTVYTDHLTPGEYVPVTLKFQINNQYYYGETGFTP